VVEPLERIGNGGNPNVSDQEQQRDPIMYVLIDGDPFLSRVRAYRERRISVYRAVKALLDEVGADSISVGFGALKFPPGKTPPGFKKPNGRGFAAPRKDNAEMLAKLAALPRPPSGRDVIKDGDVPFQLSYADKDSPESNYGSGSIGFFWDGAKIGWVGDQYFAVIPDPAAAAARHLLDHPNHVITNGCDTWAVPTGLTRVSEARIDLLVAQEKVRAEEAATTQAAAA